MWHIAEGYRIDRATLSLLKVDTPSGPHDFLKEVEQDFKIKE
jgi:hypothetical protein